MGDRGRMERHGGDEKVESLSRDGEGSREGVEEKAEDEGQYLTGLKLGLVMLGLCLAVLLVGLVCISTQNLILG